MRGACSLSRHSRHAYVFERIKELDRQLKFLVKKFAHVRHACASATKKDALWAISLLLRAIVSNRTHQLRMQPRHGVSYDLRDASYIGLRRFGSACQSDSTVPVLSSFRCTERLVKFFGNCGCDRTAADGKTTRENSSGLDKENVGRARANIQQQRAALQICVVVTKRVVQTHGCHIDDPGPQPDFFDCIVDFLEQIPFDRDNHHLKLFAKPASHELVIPHHLIDWEWNVLLRFE